MVRGGLGVRRLREFNLSLLGKWCWRMLVEKEGLWYRVLKARYDEEGGPLREGGSHCSTWWRSVCRVREGVGEGVGRWFDNTFVVLWEMVMILYFGKLNFLAYMSYL